MGDATKNFYQLTSQGRALWSRRKNVALPSDYRRILGLVDFSGHIEVIRGQLARYPDHVVDGWLTEFQAINLIKAISVKPPSMSELARKTKPPPLDSDDKQQIAEDAKFADISLSRLGVYVAHERVSNRAPNRKTPKQTLALVVEDDPDQLALAVLRLTNAGYPVETADCVKAALGTLRVHTPDAIFLDVMLPDGDGLDFLATLRRHPATAPLPIIMVTAKSEPEDVEKGLALGADGYITKPYGRNTLDYVLRYVMRQEIPDPRVAAMSMRQASSGKR